MYLEKKPMISIHIPKCGGQSVLKILENWLGGSRVLTHYRGSNGQLPHRIEDFEKREGAVIHGHFNAKLDFGIEDYYPGVEQFITFLRDPLEMHISLFHYKKTRFERNERMPKLYDPNQELDDYLLSAKPYMLNYFHTGINSENYKRYIDSKFVFIGFTKHFEQSIKSLASVFGKTVESIPKVNAGFYAASPSKEVVETFRSRCKLEYAFYNYAYESFMN